MLSMFRLFLLVAFVIFPVTVFAQSQSFKHCTYDYLKFCSAYSISSREGKDCMKRHGPRLSDRCITALVSDGVVTLDEVKDIADDAGLEIVEEPDGSLRKRRKVIAFFDPPIPERNPRRLAAEQIIPPLPERNPQRVAVVEPVTIPEPEEIKPVPPPEIEQEPAAPVEPTPPPPEQKPETVPEPKKEKSIIEKAIEVIKKGYEKDYIRKPQPLQPKVTPQRKPSASKIIKKRKATKNKAVKSLKKNQVRMNRVKKSYKKKYSVQAQDRRRNKRLHGFDSDFEVTPGGYGSNFQFNERFRIQN